MRLLLAVVEVDVAASRCHRLPAAKQPGPIIPVALAKAMAKFRTPLVSTVLGGGRYAPIAAVTMKRIPRLRQPSAVLTQCLQSSTTSSTHPAVSRAAATTATAMATTSRLARPRDFSTTTPMPFRPSPTPWAADTSVSKVQEQVEPSLLTTASEEPVDLQSEPYDDQTEAEFADEIAPEDLIETDLVIPSSSQDFELAPRSDDLEAGGVVDYKPAETAEGLDIVGGTTDWFSKDEHLPPSKLDSFERFAPKTLIDDPAELELCVCRAVVETLAVEQARPHQLLGRPWATRLTKKGSKLRPHIIEFNDGKARLKGGVVQILELLFPDKKAKESSSTAEIEYPNSIKAHTAYAKMATDWKKVSLTDVKFRFAVRLSSPLPPLLPLRLRSPSNPRNCQRLGLTLCVRQPGPQASLPAYRPPNSRRKDTQPRESKRSARPRGQTACAPERVRDDPPSRRTPPSAQC